MTSTTSHINILGLDRQQLEEQVAQWGNRPFRARQLMRWIHQRGMADFSQMTDLARVFREQLVEQASIEALTPSQEQASEDGTIKWLFDVGSNNSIETVFIPEDDRGTLCISSQAGCTVGCPFCSTGHQGFNRNLTAAEIIGQLWFAEHTLQRQPDATRVHKDRTDASSVPARVVSNVVMMGMGEPLLNYDAVVTAWRLEIGRASCRAW